MTDSITGAIADTLNCALNSPVCQARFALREAGEIGQAIQAGAPSLEASHARL